MLHPGQADVRQFDHLFPAHPLLARAAQRVLDHADRAAQGQGGASFMHEALGSEGLVDPLADRIELVVGQRPQHQQEPIAPAHDVIAAAHQRGQQLRGLHHRGGIARTGLDPDQPQRLVERIAALAIALVEREVGRDLVGEVAFVAQPGHRIGLAGLLQPCPGHVQFQRACLHFPCELSAESRVALLLPAERGIGDRREQRAHQDPEQPGFMEQRLDAKGQRGRLRAPCAGIVGSKDLELVIARGQVGVVGTASPRVLERVPGTVVAEQAITQLHAAGILENQRGDFERQVAVAGFQFLGRAAGIDRAPARRCADPLDRDLRRQRVLADVGGVERDDAVAGW